MSLMYSILIFLFYLVPVFFCQDACRRYHRYNGTKLSGDDLFLILMPIFNIAATSAFAGLTEIPEEDEEQS